MKVIRLLVGCWRCSCTGGCWSRSSASHQKYLRARTGFVLPPCSHTGDPLYRYGFTLGRPRQRHGTGDFPGLPVDPVSGSFYTCARETYTYRETLDLRGSGLPPGPPAAPALWCLSAALRATPVVTTDSPRRDPVSGTYRGIFQVRRRTGSMGVYTRAFVLYPYRETLNLRGSDLPIPIGIHFACRAFKTPIDSLQPYGRALLSVVTTDYPWRDPVSGTGPEFLRVLHSNFILIGGP